MSELTRHWRSLFDKKYLGAWNLYVNGQYRTAKVTISDVREEEVTMQGGRKSMALLVYIVGKNTPMIINKTMGKAIEKMHGREPAGWKGKSITLYVEQGFRTKEGPADVLRIRNEKAGSDLKQQLQETAPAAPEAFGDDDAQA